MLRCFCNTILPGDQELGLPEGSDVNMERYLQEHGLNQRMSEYLELINVISVEDYECSFVDLNAEYRFKTVEKSRRKNNRLAAEMIVHCLKAYYTHTSVLKAISAGSVPPFPEGNYISEPDWSLLEPVYERGRIFRETS